MFVGKVVVEALAPYLHLRGPLFDVMPHTVTVNVSVYFAALGMPWTAHNLRHTYATNLYQVSRDLRFVQEQCGHASPATTAIYARYSDDAAALAVTALDDLSIA